jgi:hypothetical protein
VGPAFERRPATDAVAMIEPPGYGFAALVTSIARDACLAARKTESVFVLSIFMKLSGVSSQKTEPEEMPALAKKTSRRPYVSRASCTTALTEGSSEASKVRVWMVTLG